MNIRNAWDNNFNNDDEDMSDSDTEENQSEHTSYGIPTLGCMFHYPFLPPPKKGGEIGTLSPSRDFYHLP